MRVALRERRKGDAGFCSRNRGAQAELGSDSKPEVRPSAGIGGGLDDGGVAERSLDRLDPAFQEGVFFARRRVVGVLLQVAELLGRLDPGDDLRTANARQLVVFGSKTGDSVRRDPRRVRRSCPGGRLCTGCDAVDTVALAGELRRGGSR